MLAHRWDKLIAEVDYEDLVPLFEVPESGPLKYIQPLLLAYVSRFSEECYATSSKVRLSLMKDG
jgi:hypothetical protein